MKKYTVSHGGEVFTGLDVNEALKAADALAERFGGVPSIAEEKASVPAVLAPVLAPVVAPVVAAVVAPVDPTWGAVSDFGHGKQVVDGAAVQRIEAQRAVLAAAGIRVNVSEQLFDTGTRMARVGYETQAERKRAHEARRDCADVAQDFIAQIQAEKREDVVISAGELAKGLTVNGKIAFGGLSLTEHALRGVCQAIASKGLMSYVLGLRDRCINRSAVASAADTSEEVKAVLRAQNADDKRKIAELLTYECSRAGDVALKLRTRKGPSDIFAVVGPKYAPADAPDVLPQIIDTLPHGAKGSFAYDPITTAWDFSADVWTPTPVHEQAVGEVFTASVHFRSADNGTSAFRGGGGVEMLRCLNASTYMAANSEGRRIHRGAKVLYDIAEMLASATTAIEALVSAWGVSRQSVVEMPAEVTKAGLTLEEALPGFWRSLLTDRRSELVGVLPGRSEHHIPALTKTFLSERRDSDRFTRADMAQGWTRYVQGQPLAIRETAEEAIGSWLVKQGRIGYESA
jgi:hypothetical protein